MQIIHMCMNDDCVVNTVTTCPASTIPAIKISVICPQCNRKAERVTPNEQAATIEMEEILRELGTPG